MLTQIKSSKGFTLPELIIGGALLALLLGAVFNIISTAYRINENTTTNQNLQTTKQVMLYLFPEMETVTAINGSTNNTESSPKSCVKLSAQYLMVLHLDIISRSIFPLF